MANILCNLDTNGQIVYPINEGMSDEIKRNELTWCHIFYDSEILVRSPIPYGRKLYGLISNTHDRLSQFTIS